MLLLALVSIALVACGDDTSTAAPAAASTPAAASGAQPAAGPVTVSAGATPPVVNAAPVKAANGLQYIDLKVGDGAVATAGNQVQVNYTGWLAANGKKFDSSLDRGRPFPFVLGAHQVIDGWDQGVAGMKIGGVRRLIIPPALGYGAQGNPPVIPQNADLIFDVQLLGIGK